jgi:hypothetical protein
LRRWSFIASISSAALGFVDEMRDQVDRWEDYEVVAIPTSIYYGLFMTLSKSTGASAHYALRT